MVDLIDLYKKIYLIRKVEEVIINDYYNDEMKTPMHMSMGSEAISVGVCSALKDRGQYFSTYRSHAPYLASGGDLYSFFSEMLGKKDGISGGKAGSMHLASPATGHLSSSAIVASNIPVAVGAAWANKIKKNKKIVVSFFGDGAMDEGNFWESINMACLWKVPIIFICEDNGLAVHTSQNKRQGYKNITNIISQFNIKTFDNQGIDVEDVYNFIESSINYIDNFNSPVFIKFNYYRYLEHVGVNEDTGEEYRKEENKIKKDPLEVIKNKSNFLNIDTKSIDESILKIISDSFNKAKNCSISNCIEVYKDVFYV